ncbi:hypothetical protein ACO2I3_17965 [Leptospira interrogans]
MKSAAVSEIRAETIAPALRLLVLARAAGETGATQGELARDLAPYVTHKLAPAAWRDTLARVTTALVVDGSMVIGRSRAELTDAGREFLVRELGGKPLPKTWPEIRDVRIIARVLGLEGASLPRLKALAKPDGLRAAILVKAFSLKIRGAPSTAKLRQALATVALERAFGNKLKGGLGDRTGLAPKAGRLLAGQLAIRPRDFGTDGRLVAALAAEQVGAFQIDADALRTAIIRASVTRSLSGDQPQTTPQPIAVVRSSAPELAPAPRPEPELPPRPAAATRPDLAGFANVVQSAASARAEGWPGNRKAFISHVWSVVQEKHPEWGLTDIEFKAMLAEAHRTGHVVLANADLKDKKSMKDLQDSAVAYKNTVWHFVRVET